MIRKIIGWIKENWFFIGINLLCIILLSQIHYFYIIMLFIMNLILFKVKKIKKQVDKKN